MANEKRKREGAQLLLRFSEGSGLREVLKREAALNGRTLTAEIIFRLENSVAQQEELSPSVSSTGISEELDKRLRTEKWELLEAIKKLQGEIDEVRDQVGLAPKI
ncbi:hypothetical protein [Pseudorhizobium marinum]|uniref:hypothetical protein n=1 Tax=Pseudorhizobium marinum TaxID=1496690 RepID=UPI001AEC65C9|nr:hypothetical protein [Pseudorhizobium marinum]